MSNDSTEAYLPRAHRDDLPPLASGGMVRCYGPLIYLAMRLRDGEEPVEDPAAFRQSVVARLDTARNMALQSGFHREEVNDADFAVTALLDETVLVREGQLRDVWIARTLQLERYGTEHGGERFFDLLRGGGGSGSPRVELMELYLLCLMAGFAGKYQGDLPRLQRLTEGLQGALRTKLGETPRSLSPNTKSVLPKRRRSKSRLPSAWLVLAACVFFVLLMWVVTLVAVKHRAERSVDLLEERTKLVGPTGSR
ncbi:MAG: type IVB secretion system protein IcmH/DotU [Myxococcota bacterium]|nr:type IVB secretion system protein IcmH/DotU [Myxococcota bacterium]